MPNRRWYQFRYWSSTHPGNCRNSAVYLLPTDQGQSVPQWTGTSAEGLVFCIRFSIESNNSKWIPGCRRDRHRRPDCRQDCRWRLRWPPCRPLFSGCVCDYFLHIYWNYRKSMASPEVGCRTDVCTLFVRYCGVLSEQGSKNNLD